MNNIKELKDIHKNKMCFIYGAGCSLNLIDENKLTGYIGIAVNSGILKAKKCKNLYYVSDDLGSYYWSYFQLLFELENCKVLLYKEKFEKVYDKLERIKNRCYEFSHKSFFSPPDIYNFDGLILTKDEPIIGARNGVNSALHISYIMGCNPIILIGVDNQLSQDGKNYRYFWQYEKENQPYRIKGTRFNFLTQNLGFDSKSFIDYWRHFSNVNEDILGKKVEIINCSDTPEEFNFFPKMSIEEVLKKYGEVK